MYRPVCPICLYDCDISDCDIDMTIQFICQQDAICSVCVVMVLLFDRPLLVYCLLRSADAQSVLKKHCLNLDGDTLNVSRAWDKAHRREESDRLDKSCRWEESGGRSPEPKRSSQEEWDGRTIEVYGFDSSATGNAIVLLFEREFPSADVTVQSVQRWPDKNVTYLTFETAEG